jgi:RHS repeat-associated protein
MLKISDAHWDRIKHHFREENIPDARADYRYNGVGERVRRTTDIDDTYTLYDEAGQWLGDYAVNGLPLEQVIWLDDLPVGLLAGSGASATLYHIQPDHLGTPRVVIDPSRDVTVWCWELKGEAFGATPLDPDPDRDGVSFVFDMRYPGQRYDSVSGLHYNYFRDYDPGTGRYVQSDPIGLAGGINTYAYVGGNPVMWTDPLGLEVLLCSQPAQISGMGWVDHQWIRTDTVEAGMGGTRGNVLGNQSGDMPGDPVQVTDHRDRHKQPGASCKTVDNVDEARVNAQLEIGRPLGRWGPTNQCQSFTAQLLWNASTVDLQVEQNRRLLNSMVPGLR